MTEVVTTTPGLYPLPDHSKEELADLKGHQKDDLISGDEDSAVVEACDRARTEVVGRQREAGLDRLVEGQLRWDDMLAHPLAVSDAVEMRGIVRYYDNNNFYRGPVVTGELSATGDVAGELERTDVPAGELQAVLPGPYTLADLATDDHYGDGFLEAVADFLAAEIERFPDHATLWLMEPSLVTAPPEDGEGARASEAIDAVAGATDADAVAHTYFGALEETVHAHLLDAGVDAVGYDLVNAHEESLYLINEYGTTDDVALGVVDGQNTAVETPAEIRDRIEWVDEQAVGADFERVYVTPNTELFYLPVERFEAKLDALAAVDREVVA
jgi:5-methyltetrahydropteroyltriglutamate--homocysteine methyltransferase